MSLAKSLISDGNFTRQIMQGDVLAAAEVFPATVAGNAPTITGAMLTATIIQRTPSAAATDTLDTAANILAALTAGPGLTGVQPGTSWRVRWYNTAAFAITVTATANTGMSVAAPTVNASSVKDYLVTVVNGTPAKTTSATTVNASAVISGVPAADLAALTVGMVVTSASAGQQGATILAVNLAAGTLTLSANATSTNATAIAYTFSPVISLQGLGQGLL
jgi:hypothetical protein